MATGEGLSILAIQRCEEAADGLEVLTVCVVEGGEVATVDVEDGHDVALG